MSNHSKHRPAPNRPHQASKSSEIDAIVTSQGGGSKRAGGTGPNRPGGSSAKRFPIVWVIVGVLVVLAGALAVFSAGSDDEEATEGTVSTAPDGDVVSSEGELQPVTVTGAPLPQFEATDGDAAVGVVAPTLDGFDFDGNAVQISPSGDPTLLVFLAHWCPHCNNEIPVLNEWRDAGLVPDGLQVVGVSTAVAENRDFYPPSKWLVEKDWTWPVMADSEANEAAAAYGVTGFPAIMMIDGDGTVLARASGEMGSLALQEFVADALGTSAAGA